MEEQRGETLDLLAAEAERARHALGVASASVCVWERDLGILRALVNTGHLAPGEQARPADEAYPVHSFPALVSLLEGRTPYCFGLGDPIDISSASLAASFGKETQAAAPISIRGEVWGSLWVATLPGDRPLSRADLPGVVRAANGIARAVAAVDFRALKSTAAGWGGG
jgi:hypothetical protein